MAVVQTFQMLQLSAGPANSWTTINPTLPMALIGFETNTKYFKVGDGVTSWNSLPYASEENVTDEILELLTKAGAADGPCLLDENGTIPINSLPPVILNHVKYVADIAARDAIAYEDRTCIVVVLDAAGDVISTEQAISYTLQTIYDAASAEVTDGGVAIIDFGAIITSEPTVNQTTGDLTVHVGGAVYVWQGTSTNGMWLKISEFESMDINFNMYLNSITETLDVIIEGSEYVHFTVENKDKLNLVITVDDTHLISSLTPTEIKNI